MHKISKKLKQSYNYVNFPFFLIMKLQLGKKLSLDKKILQTFKNGKSLRKKGT